MNDDDRALQEEPEVNVPALALAWLWVGLPLIWGISQTLRQALALFG